MTRTAADVQAEIDAHQARDREWFDTAEAELDATAHGPAWDAQNWLLRRRLVDSVAKNDALTAERDHLARLELDAATPPDVRATALRLRAAHRSVDGWAMGAEDTWEALDTAEAAAWAAVAREAGR